MGNVFAEITVKNAEDVGRARDELIKEEEVRSVALTAVVDANGDEARRCEAGTAKITNLPGLMNLAIRQVCVIGHGVVPVKV